MSLVEYIDKYYGGSQAAFARAAGVKPPQVTQWINKGCVVENHKLYSFRRDLPAPSSD